MPVYFAGAMRFVVLKTFCMNETFIAASPVTKDLLEIIKKTSATNSPVLLIGELGCGKKTFAKIIHANCSRKNFPFFYYNCRTSDDIDFVKVSSENGSIFLDEIESLKIEYQEKLLDLIQSKISVKIIASTKENLADFVQKGSFVEELFFRLNVFPVRIPALRVRKEDILPLAENFLVSFSEKYGKKIIGFSEDSKNALVDYSWPGNILELRDIVSRSVLLCRGSMIQNEDLHLVYIQSEPESGQVLLFDDEDKTLKTAVNDFKRRYVVKILDECGWNQTKAGKVLGIQRTYVSRLMNELHIRDKIYKYGEINESTI